MSHVTVLTNCSYVYVFLKNFTKTSSIMQLSKEIQDLHISFLWILEVLVQRGIVNFSVTNHKFRNHLSWFLKEMILCNSCIFRINFSRCCFGFFSAHLSLILFLTKTRVYKWCSWSNKENYNNWNKILEFGSTAMQMYL